MTSFRTWEFKKLSARLDDDTRAKADRAFGYWTADTKHPSLNFECVEELDEIWSVRVGIGHRALCVKRPQFVYIWFWIGTHAEYDLLLK